MKENLICLVARKYRYRSISLHKKQHPASRVRNFLPALTILSGCASLSIALPAFVKNASQTPHIAARGFEHAASAKCYEGSRWAHNSMYCPGACAVYCDRYDLWRLLRRGKMPRSQMCCSWNLTVSKFSKQKIGSRKAQNPHFARRCPIC